MPPAARITDGHSCPKHHGGPVIEGDSTVIIGHQPAARVGDHLKCPPGKDAIAQGEPTVIIGYRFAARQGDKTAHDGRVSKGCPTVIIGTSPQAITLRTDKPFCEECERARLEREEQQRRGRQ